MAFGDKEIGDLLEELERIAAAQARAQHLRSEALQNRAEELQKVTTWRWFLCAWPFLPIVLVFGGNIGGILALFFFLFYPGYVAWTAIGTLAAGIRLRRKAALAGAAFTANAMCLIASGLMLWGAYTNRISVHM